MISGTKNTALKWISLLLATCLFVGCANKGKKSADSEPKAERKPLPLPELSADHQISILWQRSVGKGSARRHHHKLNLNADSGRLYMVDVFGLVVALDADTGGLIWQTTIPPFEQRNDRRRKRAAFVSAGPGFGDGRLFLGSTQGEVIALSDQDGSLLWRVFLGSEVLAPPRADDSGLVFVQTSDGKLVALNAQQGEQVWIHRNQVPRLSLRGTAAPAIVGDHVLMGLANGKISLFEAVQGELVWERRVAVPEGSSELDRIIDIDHTPLISSGVTYAAAYQSGVRAFSLRDGEILWEHKINTAKGLSLGFNNVYVIDEDDQVVALSERTGVPVWTNLDLLYRNLATPVTFRNYLIAGDERGYIYLLNQSDGILLSYARVGGKAGIHNAPVVFSDKLYVLDGGGILSALSIIEDDRG